MKHGVFSVLVAVSVVFVHIMTVPLRTTCNDQWHIPHRLLRSVKPGNSRPTHRPDFVDMGVRENFTKGGGELSHLCPRNIS